MEHSPGLAPDQKHYLISLLDGCVVLLVLVRLSTFLKKKIKSFLTTSDFIALDICVSNCPTLSVLRSYVMPNRK